MQTQRIIFSMIIPAFILFSCNQKKKINSPANPEAITKPGILNISAPDAVSTAAYSNEFTESIKQQFTVTGKKVTVISSKGGLKVTVDPARLVKEDGSPVDGKIYVKLIELTNSSDLFRSNAATVSDGRLLASGGSYFIGMECNGQKLKLKQEQTLQVSFPVLKNGEMELFYGERNEENEMNWKRTTVLLEPQKESVSIVDSNPFEVNNSIPDSLSEMLPARIYRTLNDPVYYYKKRMTLKELVDILNNKEPRVYLQTISYWPKNLPTDRVLDTNYLTTVYGPRFQYILRTCRQKDEEETEIARRKIIRDSLVRNWKPRSLAGQLQKYYAPSQVRNLGWINCDRFYRYNEQTDVDVDFPITLNNSKIQYFIIYKSFNGLSGSVVNISEDPKFVLNGMPVGEPVTLVAFTKSKGVLYQCKEDFVIAKKKKLSLEFKIISEDELKKIFSGNVRI